MKFLFVLCLALFNYLVITAQIPVKITSGKNGAVASSDNDILRVKWPAGNSRTAQIEINLNKDNALIKSLSLIEQGKTTEIASSLDPAFILTVGKRDLVPQKGWNIFFDKVPDKPHHAYHVNLEKKSVTVSEDGTRTVVKVDGMTAETFTGALEITLYNGSPLLNIAAVISTPKDSTAILFDAGLISKKPWAETWWSNTSGQLQHGAMPRDSAAILDVKYRTIMSESPTGTLAIFPAPHQYFYPLDEAFNLKFVWHGENYRNLDGYGMGIRQDLFGDRRFVPWFNAPPHTKQRLNFFCLLSEGKAQEALSNVKKFTNNDTYVSLPGYKTMASHFHNEFIMKVVLAGKPVPEIPSFVTVFKTTGVDIVHLGEFHYTANPRGPAEKRLPELEALFAQCKRLSDDEFLLLPGEEPNEFLGGHWLQIFPRPVYWIMSRGSDEPFVEDHPTYGKVYRIADEHEMLKLLELENGLAWTAHPRTKGSTGYPDQYKNKEFFTSKHFLGAAWKAMPADLSQPKLGNRVLDLMDDMNNWGAKKQVIAEADLFTIEPENEMYAHLNVNYLRIPELPDFKDGWQVVLDAMRKGSFFSSTGEVLLPDFTVNGKTTGDTLVLDQSGKTNISFTARWTFPLHYAEIISGDGKKVYRDRIDLKETLPFGENTWSKTLKLKGRKWVRLEVWDAASNGAFTQCVWIQ